MKLRRLFFLILGCVCLALGCVGIVLPVLPTVPFFLATVFCFANSSEKLHTWFLGTELYQKHLDSFVKKKGMTAQTKAGILTSVTLLMAVGFFLMLRKALYIPCTRRRCPLWYSGPAVFRRNSRPRHSPSVCVAWFPPPFCFVPAWPEVNALHCGWAFPSEAALPLPVRQPLFRL